MHIDKFFRHRVNTVKGLGDTLPEYGIELDLRTNGNEIILEHDPFVEGERFEDFLETYHHSGIILNTKVDGIQEKLIALMSHYHIEDYFFLDLPLPTIVKLQKSGFRKIALRFSEFEPLESLAKFENNVEWVWVDCFTKNVLTPDVYTYLHEHFKICIVSPELQGHPLEWINDFKNDYREFDIDAVCTKRPELWK